MFQKYSDLISQLKGKHQYFDRLYSQYYSLERQIARLETEFRRGYSMKVVILKLERLDVKQELQTLLEEEAKRFRPGLK
ncbi:DUF465 domain-containing protein [Escherichia coli]